MVSSHVFLILLLHFLVQGALTTPPDSGNEPVDPNKHRITLPPIGPAAQPQGRVALPSIHDLTTMNTEAGSEDPITLAPLNPEVRYEVAILEPGSKYGVRGGPIQTFRLIPSIGYHRVPSVVVVVGPDGKRLYLTPGQIIRLRTANVVPEALHHNQIPVLPVAINTINDGYLAVVVLPPQSHYFLGRQKIIIPYGEYSEVPQGMVVYTALGTCLEASGQVVRIIDKETLDPAITGCRKEYHSRLPLVPEHLINKPPYTWNTRAYVRQCIAQLFHRCTFHDPTIY